MAKSTSSLASFSSMSSSSSSSSSSGSSDSIRPSSIKTKKNCVKAQRLSVNSNNSSSNQIDRRKRLAANARERKRMHLLNKAYDELRLRLVDAENKSKYDVLVQAKEYIQALATICEKFDKDKESEQKINVTSPKPTLIQQQQQQDFIIMKNSPITIQTPLDMTIYDCSSPLSTTSSISSHHSQLSFNTTASHSPINVTNHSHYRTTTTTQPIPSPYTTNVVHNNHDIVCCTNQQQQYSTYTI